MKLINILAILTIFCIALTAGIACASEDVEGVSADDTGDNVNADDGETDTPGEGEDDDPSANDKETSDWIEYKPNMTDGNNTNPLNSTNNDTINKTINTTGNATGNVTGNATGNMTPVQRAINSLVTGNPVIILLIALAAIGGYGIIKRK